MALLRRDSRPLKGCPHWPVHRGFFTANITVTEAVGHNTKTAHTADFAVSSTVKVKIRSVCVWHCRDADYCVFSSNDEIQTVALLCCSAINAENNQKNGYFSREGFTDPPSIYARLRKSFFFRRIIPFWTKTKISGDFFHT